ncbi:MAG: redox-sensing transcriptional repressor Rex [Myxococcota bacterium]|nr:redox-sensing transcriptional repressor Rex [Myxococcota bacterium]
MTFITRNQHKAQGQRNPGVSPKTIERLSVYRRTLANLPASTPFIYSHELAAMCGSSAAQVRRDLMVIGTAGCPSRGYAVAELIELIDKRFAGISSHAVALVGAGTLGRSLIAYLQRRYHRLSIAAVFDKDPDLTSRVVYGIRCYPMGELRRVVEEQSISIAVIALPDASAQEVAEQLTAAGITGILNFAPVSLRVPSGTCVVDIDIAAALDKLAFFARTGRDQYLREVMDESRDKHGH